VINHEIPIAGDLVLMVSTPYNPYRASSLANASTLALILNFCSAIALGFILTTRNRLVALLLSGAILLFFYTVLLSGSKGAVLGFVSMIVYFLCAVKKIRKIFFLHGTIAVVVMLVISLVVIVTFQLKYEDIIPRVFAFLSSQAGQESESLATRGEMWTCGFKNLINKTNGMGLVGGFTEYCPYPHAHNIYFSVLFDFGILGAILLIAVLITVFRYFIRTAKYQGTYLQTMSIAIFGGLVAMGVHSLFDHAWHKGFFWLYPALLIATCNLVKKEVHAGEKKEQGS
jgi:oligosaccharide repeat unit polymerase